MTNILLKTFITECLISETIETDTNFSLEIFKGLLALAKKFAANINFFVDSCAKNADGKCISFPGTMINVSGLENVNFLLWYSVTNDKSENSLLYFPVGTPYDVINIPNENRKYEFALGYFEQVDSNDNANDTNEKLSSELYRCLVQDADFRSNIFHEVGHLKSLSKMSTGAASKLWDYETSNKDFESIQKRDKLNTWIKYHGIEAYPQMMDVIGRLAFKYENQPSLKFRRRFPTAQDFVIEFHPTISLNKEKNKKNRESSKYARKLAEIWEFIASGSLE